MLCSVVFFFNDTATTEIYTLSLHDALPIYLFGVRVALCVRDRFRRDARQLVLEDGRRRRRRSAAGEPNVGTARSEEHTSELQSRQYIVCRLLLEKKKNKIIYTLDYSHLPFA